MLKLLSAPPPAILRSAEVRELRGELLAHLRRDEQERRQRRAPIEQNLFFAPSLLEPVAYRCRGKCAYCETPAASYDGVQHFRPLRDARQRIGPPDHDHYAWLAFEWNNLLLACGPCSKAKGTVFPTAGERAPYLASLEETRTQETALLIDPLHEEPTRHFDFLLTGHCEPRTPRGAITAEVLDLNRPGLIERRAADFARLVNGWRASLAQANASPLVRLLDPAEPHVGARFTAMRRLLAATPIGGVVISGSLHTLPRRLTTALRDVPPREAQGLLDRFEMFLVADQERSHRLEAQPVRSWSNDDQAYSADTTFAVRPQRPAAADRELRSVAITNFKGVEALTLTMPSSRSRRGGAPCLMLLGENAVGKSSTLSALALALIGTRAAYGLKLKPEDLVRSTALDRWDQLDSPPPEVEVAFHYSDREGAFRLVDGAIHGTPDPVSIVLGYGPRRYFDRTRADRPSGAHHRVRTLFDPLAVIPYPGTWLKGLKDERFDVVARALRDVFSLNEQDDLVRDMDGRICVNDGGRITPVERLSEGYRSVFVMTVDIIRELLDHWSNLEEAQAVVLIDEIETHLHPRWKMSVMSSLRKALPRVQFIATTHDPLCLRGMDDGEVVVLQRDADNRVVSLEGLPSLRGMRAEQLLTSDYFGLSSTVDPETELALARFAGQVARAPDPDAEASALDPEALVGRLMLGDSAREQVVHEALARFVEERERPRGALRPDVRADAVAAVLRAFSDVDPAEPDLS